jgi:hypothetical protein
MWGVEPQVVRRVKFMTRPGDQWALHRVIFAKIHDLFEANGIRFANREVTVRIADESSEHDDQAVDTRRKAASAAACAVQDDHQTTKHKGGSHVRRSANGSADDVRLAQASAA